MHASAIPREQSRITFPKVSKPSWKQCHAMSASPFNSSHTDQQSPSPPSVSIMHACIQHSRRTEETFLTHSFQEQPASMPCRCTHPQFTISTPRPSYQDLPRMQSNRFQAPPPPSCSDRLPCSSRPSSRPPLPDSGSLSVPFLVLHSFVSTLSNPPPLQPRVNSLDAPPGPSTWIQCIR